MNQELTHPLPGNSLHHIRVWGPVTSSLVSSCIYLRGMRSHTASRKDGGCISPQMGLRLIGRSISNWQHCMRLRSKQQCLVRYSLYKSMIPLNALHYELWSIDMNINHHLLDIPGSTGPSGIPYMQMLTILIVKHRRSSSCRHRRCWSLKQRYDHPRHHIRFPKEDPICGPWSCLLRYRSSPWPCPRWSVSKLFE